MSYLSASRHNESVMDQYLCLYVCRLLFAQAIIEKVQKILIYLRSVGLIEDLMSVVIIQLDADFARGVLCVYHKSLAHAFPPGSYRVLCT